MPKFTLFFKDKAINSIIFDAGIIHIGRDESNDLTVDSLAVAPAHAAVIVNESGCLIKQLHDKFPLIVNNTETKEAQLKDKDQINIGKHYIVYSHPEAVMLHTNKLVNDELSFLNRKIADKNLDREANLQFMNGPNIGRILTLKKTLTRIGNKKAGIVVISRREEGYYISNLDHDIEKKHKVNNIPIGNKPVLLNHNDIVAVDKINMQFFLNKA